MSNLDVLKLLKDLRIQAKKLPHFCLENFAELKANQASLGNVMELRFSSKKGQAGVAYDLVGRQRLSNLHVVGLLGDGAIIDLGSEPIVYDSVHALLTDPHGLRILDEYGPVDVKIDGDLVDLVQEKGRFMLKRR